MRTEKAWRRRINQLEPVFSSATEWLSFAFLNLWEGMAGESNHIPIGSVECQYQKYLNGCFKHFQAGAGPNDCVSQ